MALAAALKGAADEHRVRRFGPPPRPVTLTAVIDQELLSILVCPESRQPLAAAPAETLERLNRAIAEGRLKNCGGESVEAPLEEALVREDGQRAYAVRDDIPILLVEEGLPLE